MAESKNEKITKGKIEFRRKDVIGRTPFSTVFKGTFEGRIDVAVKRISLDLAKLAENEIDVLLVKTDHDNVVKYYCKEQDDDFCYIAMQLCLCNLEEYVEKKGNYRPGLPNTPVEEILRGAAEGLSHIHKKDIVHRDIKPSNILLFVKENKLVAKISDFGVSRIIPDHRTVMGNFSAGTDLYKAPELLTPAFSWRSDVYAFGLVVFYVLSKGKHLFNNNLSQIIKGNPVNLQELNGQPTALLLVKWLTAFDQEARPRMAEVVYHPFFWDDEKRLNFIKDVHQRTEDKQNVFLKEVIEEDSHHVICSSPDNCGNLRTTPDPAACADWTSSLTPGVKADCPRKVNTKSCAELVRIIRNKSTHFYDLKEAVKAEYGGNIEGFRRYWMERFPSLVVHLWENVETTYLAALFGGYCAPDSVRRRNLETTLIQAAESGEFGDPQELQNKVKRLGSIIWARVLRFVVEKEKKEHLEALLKGDIDTDIEHKQWVLTTLLYNVVQDDDVEVAQLLIEHGAVVDREENVEWGPFHVATYCGHLAVVQLLIERGALVNCKDDRGWSPLHVAASRDHSAVAKLLIERGAEVNYKNKHGSTPLHTATYEGHSAVVKLLIEHGAEVNCKDKDGSTTLHEAAYKGYSGFAKLLIERGAEVNSKDKNGSAPLHVVAHEDYSVNVKLLKEHGAEVGCEREYRERKTRLYEASYNSKLAVAKLLIEHGAEVNSKDKYGSAPLHEAVSNGHQAVVKLLIENGAEISSKDAQGNTPLDYATENSFTELSRFVRNFPDESLPRESDKFTNSPKRRRLE